MELETRTIGQTHVDVTRLGFGTAPLGAMGGAVSEDEATQIVEAAWDLGIRYFDTAPLYGHGLAEKRLGSVLSHRDRDDFVLSTKVGRLLVPEAEGTRGSGMRDNEPYAIRYDYSRDAVMRSVESSLQRLGLDRIDVVLCHDIDVWTHGSEQPRIYAEAIGGALPAMQELRDQGVVSAIGLGVNEWEVCHRVLDDIDVDCFLLAGRFTLLEQTALDQLLPACVERNVSVIVGGPYNSGLLTNVDRAHATYDYKPAPDELWEQTLKLREMCSHHGTDIRAAALQYPLRHPAVAAVIPGARSIRDVSENRAFVESAIPAALWSDLADAGLIRR